MRAHAQARLDTELLGNLGRYRRYRACSLRDLLRVIRNKHNHWRELPEPLQARLGPPPDGFLRCAPYPKPNPTVVLHVIRNKAPPLGRAARAAAGLPGAAARRLPAVRAPNVRYRAGPYSYRGLTKNARRLGGALQAGF
jgi:hypothetical protein